MERALKERIVGAAVLVLIAVLVVPVFLDGPADEAEVVSETVMLPGQNEQALKRQTIVLERDRSEPVPTAGGEEAAPAAAAAASGPPADEETPAPARQQPAAAADPARAEPAGASTAPPPRDAQATQSSTGMWAVQLGSFSNLENAERLAAELRGKGYAAFLSKLDGSEGTLHRVRIGPQKDRDSAEKVAARLAADGHKGQVVPHP